MCQTNGTYGRAPNDDDIQSLEKMIKSLSNDQTSGIYISECQYTSYDVLGDDMHVTLNIKCI